MKLLYSTNVVLISTRLRTGLVHPFKFEVHGASWWRRVACRRVAVWPSSSEAGAERGRRDSSILASRTRYVHMYVHMYVLEYVRTRVHVTNNKG